MKTPYLVLKIQTENDLKQEVQKKQDEFLDIYSLYLRTKIPSLREDLRMKAYELKLLDAAFSFQI